ncbi:MAG: hypothetical protein QF535_15850, partial [Anaerolineales bacterium]|nr:hypothetical protein [Anaerolineales bacterium]
SGNYYWHDPKCYATMIVNGMTWFLVRRNIQDSKWHPATDSGEGSEEYGTFDNNPQGSETFSILYEDLAWNQI